LRVHKQIQLLEKHDIKDKLLKWSQQFREVVWLDSNNYQQIYSSYDAVLAVDAFTVLQTDSEDAFDKLKEYQSHSKDWLFGYLTYDLKFDTENLKSNNFDGLEFPELFFFQPKKVFLLKGNVLEVQYLHFVDDEIDSDYVEILNTNSFNSVSIENKDSMEIKLRITKDSYFNKFQKIHQHISQGDIYEMNFCQEFYAENINIDPLHVYQNLNQISKPPFATFLKLED
jgi:para-aminobenzoate synthetase component 1